MAPYVKSEWGLNVRRREQHSWYMKTSSVSAFVVLFINLNPFHILLFRIDAKSAVDHLSGFNVAGRYLVVLYYKVAKHQEKLNAEAERKELEKLKKTYGV